MKLLKKLLNTLKFEFNSLLNSYNFWKAKRKAIKLHKLNGKRYHVVPASNTTLVVVNNDYIKRYNKAIKNKRKKINISDLIKMSYYSTPVQGLNRK